MPKPKKKKSGRSKVKYPALKPEYNLKSRYDLIDYDYLNKLSPQDLKWLNKFTEEYVCCKLDREDLENNIHNTVKLKQDCDLRNNRRNTDIYTKAKAYGRLNYFSDLIEDEYNPINEYWEEILIEELDSKKKD